MASLVGAAFPSHVPGGVVGLAQAGVGGRQHHLGVSDHAGHLLLFSALQAGRFGVQVTLWGEGESTVGEGPQGRKNTGAPRGCSIS